ncbi:MAG: DUF3883 domain-containing protein [Streptosporangiaceae bacterium]
MTFEKDLIVAERRPPAEYVTPGHPLLDGTIELIIERYDILLRQGAVLIDENDPGLVPHVLLYLQHSVVDGHADQAGHRRVVSQRASEIRYWDHHAGQLRERELAGKLPRSGMNSARARQRAEDLQGRLKQRLEDLEAERRLAPLPPVVTGGALIVPAGLLASSPGAAHERSFIERAGLNAVITTERALGRDPVQLPPGHAGYHIESRTAAGSLLFIQVKAGARGARTFTLTRTELGVGRSQAGQHILALAEVPPVGPPDVRYARHAFSGIGDPPFDAATVSLPWDSWFDRGEAPA